MGYTGTNSSVIRILFTTMFPISFIQQSTTIWAFGNNPEVQMLVNEWFPLILEGVISQQMRPHPFTQEQLQSLTMPVLLVLGQKDALVGNPENAIHLVEGIPNIRIETLNTGHLISAEKPLEFNNLVLDFLGRPEL
jgi:pimeloyl-ACP methyl ester carboxylesterase